MLRDPRIWGDDGHVFRPERFLPDEKTGAIPTLPNPEDVAFGFGRRYVRSFSSFFHPRSVFRSWIDRVCAGRYLATRAVFNLAVAICSTYEILPLEGDGEGMKEKFNDYQVRCVCVVAELR